MRLHGKRDEMLSPRAAVDVRVLILDPLPLNAKNHFELAGYHLEECFEELSEAQLLKRISDAHIVCLG